MSQAEQDAEEMKDWIDGNARVYWPYGGMQKEPNSTKSHQSATKST